MNSGPCLSDIVCTALALNIFDSEISENISQVILYKMSAIKSLSPKSYTLDL